MPHTSAERKMFLDNKKKTIGLCFGQREQKLTFKQILEKIGYAVFCPDPELGAAGMAKDIDLFIVEANCAVQHWDQLFKLRERSGFNFGALPLLVALDHDEDPAPWLKKGFDDIIPLTINETLLETRLNLWLSSSDESKNRFKSLFENAILGIYRTTPDGKVLLANPAFLKMLGFPSFEELKNKNLNEAGFEPGYSRAEFIRELEKKGTLHGFEAHWTRTDGATIHIRESVQIVKDAEGKPLYLEGTVEDITERVAAENRFQVLTESANVAIFIYDEDKFLYVNPETEKITGYTTAQLLGKNFWEVIHPDHKELVREKGQQRVVGPKVPSPYEFKILTADNETRWVDFTSEPVTYKSQPAAIGTAYDITDRKLDEKRSKEQTEALQKMVTGVSGQTGQGYFTALVQYLAAVLKVDFVFVGGGYSTEKETITTQAFCVDGEIRKNFTYSLNDTPCSDVCHRGMTIIKESAQTAYPEDEWFIENKVEAYCGIPIRNSVGDVLGNLVVMHRAPLEDTSLIEYIMQLFAVRTAAELERGEFVQQLQEGRDELETVFKSIPIPMLILNIERTVLESNPAADDYFEKMGLKLSGRFPGDTLSCIHRLDDPKGCGFSPACQGCVLRNSLLGVIENKTSISGAEAKMNLMIDGKYFLRNIKLNAAHIETETEPKILVAFEDITGLKDQSNRLSESVRRLSCAQQVAGMGFINWDSDTDELQCSNELYAIIGLPKEKLPTMTDFIKRVVGKDQRKEFIRQLRIVANDGKALNMDIAALKQNGDELWLDVRAEQQSVGDGSKLNVMGAVLDITTRKIAEEKQKESELWLKTIIENEPECVKIMTPDGKLLEMNKSGLNLIEADSFEQVNQAYLHSLITKEYRPAFKKMLKAASRGESGKLIYEIIGLKGTHRWMETYCVMVNTNKNSLRLLAVSRDITDKKNNDDFIARSLAEKEVLLKEIHHRVKNNLQVISSLLNMQIHRTDTKEVVEILMESQQRIRSMSLVHERLYESLDQAHLPAKEFVRIITSELLHTYQLNDNVRLAVDIADITLDINQAVPFGLVINELVTNALKYAYPDEQTGQIIIRLAPGINGDLTMSVEDYGVGLPVDKNFDTATTLGMTLVRVLTTQLDGELEVDRSNGTKISIKLPWRRDEKS